MRIIAGQRRGHKIEGPRPSASTRPTSDFVRESLFNILGARVVDRLVVDLFAGTGALGLEALSRGARRAIFIEKDRANVSLILRNLATLRYQDRAQVRHADAYRWMRSFERIDDRPLVVFLDPPYRDWQIRARTLNPMLAQLVEKLPADSVVALESGRILDERMLPEFARWDIRRYGNTQLALRIVAMPEEGVGGPVGPDGRSMDIDAPVGPGTEDDPDD